MLYEHEKFEDGGQVSQRAGLAIHFFVGLYFGFVVGVGAISTFTL